MIKPIYVFSGFLDAGKTTAIQATLRDFEFTQHTPTLIIRLEEGDVDYDQTFLRESNSHLVTLSTASELTKEKIEELEKNYEFDRVVLELNGLEKDEDLFKRGFAKKWELAETIAIFDTTRFTSYLTNMRTFLYDHIRYADVAIFNRADGCDTRYIRNNIKAANPRLQIVFEETNGRIWTGVDESFFDVSGTEITVSDVDYGLWYMDALDHPTHYDGKTLKVRVAYLGDIPGEKNAVMMGRKAMVCCANDITPVAFAFIGVDKNLMTKGKYYQIEGKIRVVEDTAGNPTCIVYATKSSPAANPENELVYFN